VGCLIEKPEDRRDLIHSPFYQQKITRIYRGVGGNTHLRGAAAVGGKAEPGPRFYEKATATGVGWEIGGGE